MNGGHAVAWRVLRPAHRRRRRFATSSSMRPTRHESIQLEGTALERDPARQHKDRGCGAQLSPQWKEAQGITHVDLDRSQSIAATLATRYLDIPGNAPLRLQPGDAPLPILRQSPSTAHA